MCLCPMKKGSPWQVAGVVAKRQMLYALPRKCLLSVAVADYVSTLYVCCCVAGLDSSCSSAIGVLESARFGYSCCGGRNVLTACE